MKAFITLCAVITVSLVLNVSVNGVQSARAPQSQTGDDSSKTTSTTMTTRSLERKKKPVPGTANAANAANEPNEKQTRPKNETGDDVEDEPLPTQVVPAGRRLVSSVGQGANRRGADVLNGGTGLVRMGTGLGNLLSSSVAQQAGNVRTVAKETFGMANGFGDSVSRGSVKTIRDTSDVGRDVASRLSEVTEAAVDKNKRVSRFGGRVAVVPFKVGGDVADVGTSMATIPVELSKKASKYMTDNMLPKVGASDWQEIEKESPIGKSE